MIKTTTFLFLMLTAAHSAWPQNIAINGSAELRSNCTIPDGWLQTGPAQVHYFVPGCGTSPNNQYGTQVASDGDNYVGVRAWDVNSAFTRNHFAIPTSLVAGSTYVFSGDFSLAEVSRYASASLGVYFWAGQNPPTPGPATQADVMVPTFTTNIVGWEPFSATFTAPVNATWAIVGGFNIGGTGFFVNPNGSFDGTYLYLDNLCITPLLSSCNTMQRERPMALHGSTIRNATGNVRVVSMTGQVVRRSGDLEGLPSGMYVVYDDRSRIKVFLDR